MSTLECRNCESTMTDEEIVEARKTKPELKACCPERKMQPRALNKLEIICEEIFEKWDKDQRPGKLLLALSGELKNYRVDVDEVRQALGARIR